MTVQQCFLEEKLVQQDKTSKKPLTYDSPTLHMCHALKFVRYFTRRKCDKWDFFGNEQTSKVL